MNGKIKESESLGALKDCTGKIIRISPDYNFLFLFQGSKFNGIALITH